MASQALLDQFWQALDNSKSFQALSHAEQAALRASYAEATDKQITLALAELKKDDAEMAKLDQESADLVEEQVKITHDLKDSTRKIEKEEIKENNAIDKEESLKAAEAALHELD